MLPTVKLNKMENAKEEFLSIVEGKPLKCAKVTYGDDYWDEEDGKKTMLLKTRSNNEEYLSFLKQMDFEYSNGYGGQNLFGTIWFKDGSWAERGEYDGSEWWEIKSLPDIPEELTS